MKTKATVLLILLLLALPINSYAMKAVVNYHLEGDVISNDGKPIEHAKVIISQRHSNDGKDLNSYYGLTDENGHYAIQCQFIVYPKNIFFLADPKVIHIEVLHPNYTKYSNIFNFKELKKRNKYRNTIVDIPDIILNK